MAPLQVVQQGPMSGLRLQLLSLLHRGVLARVERRGGDGTHEVVNACGLLLVPWLGLLNILLHEEISW